MKKVFLFVVMIAAAGLFTKHAAAQSKKVVADKIIGQVGDKIILRSDVENALLDLKRQAQGQENVVIPTACQIMEGQLIQKALVLQGEKDSLKISEDEIDAALDNRIRGAIQQYGSKDLLEEKTLKKTRVKVEAKRLNLRIPQPLADRLATVCSETGLSQTAIIIGGLNAELNRLEKK